MAQFDFSPYAVGGAQRPDSFSGLDPEYADALARLFQAAPENIRANLKIMSAYRSPERQAELYSAAVRKYGSEQAARKWVAPPGKSQHNHGRAVDLQYGGEDAKNWLHQNANQFGLNFPMGHENWHLEPIGARGGHGGGQPAPAQPFRGGAGSGPNNFMPAPGQPGQMPQQQMMGQPEQSKPDNFGEIMAMMAPQNQPQQQAAPQGAQIVQSGDPFGATTAAIQAAQRAKGLSALPDVNALMSLGKKPMAPLV